MSIFFLDEVNIDLDVLHSTMMYWVCCHIENATSVTIDNGHTIRRGQWCGTLPLALEQGTMVYRSISRLTLTNQRAYMFVSFVILRPRSAAGEPIQEKNQSRPGIS